MALLQKYKSLKREIIDIFTWKKIVYNWNENAFESENPVLFRRKLMNSNSNELHIDLAAYRTI